MLTEKDYCDYETCVALKELGYPTKMTFIGEQATIEIPINSGLIQLYEAQKWLREEKKIHIEIDLLMSKWYPTIVSYDRLKLVELRGYESYEEALSEGVRTSIKILQDEQKENN